MNDRDLDFFLLGVAVGALGVVGEAASGKPVDVAAVEETARALMKKVERNFAKASLLDGERLASLLTLAKGAT